MCSVCLPDGFNCNHGERRKNTIRPLAASWENLKFMEKMEETV